jgi:glycosyltransferase involved in cell wall biosynthesis
MPETARPIIAVITGERGLREIVRPLAAVGQPCVALDWEDISAQPGQAHLRFVRELWRLVGAQPGVAIFTDMNSAFLAVILLFAKLHGAPVLMRLRGDPFAETRGQLAFHWAKRQWLPWLRAAVAWLLDRPLFALVDRFVPVSHWIVRRLGIAARSTVVRIPVPLESFPPRDPAQSLAAQSPPALRLLAVTNFNFPQKVAALGRFIDDCGDFLLANRITLTVAGTGIAWQGFRTRFAERAEFAGFIREVAPLYAGHDVFVHFSDLDAFPYVVLEAQASGLPVVVNRDCGMLEQVEHERTGFIVDLPDRSTLERLLLRLRDEPELRVALGARARAHVAVKYTLEAIGRELLCVLPAARESAGSA